MRIPLKYNLRNLLRRKARSVLTAAGIALVVVVGVFMFAFSRGMLHMAKNSGSPQNVIVNDRKGASCVFSSLKAEDYNLLRNLPQIKKGPDGEPLISPEVTHQSYVMAGDYGNRPGIIRGVTQDTFKVSGVLRIVRGSPPGEGRRIAVGGLAHAALGVPASALEIGREVEFEGFKWTIVGHFEAGGTALDSQMLTEMSDYMSALKRENFSSALLRVKEPSLVAPLIASLNARNDIVVKAVTEADYYREFSEGFERIIFLAIAMAVIAGVGGLVGGMNTMYASVLGRVREIGTLQVLGFGRGAIIFSFIVESLIIAVPGGIIGCALGFTVNGLPTKLSMGAFAIRVDWIAVAGGMAVALAIGVIGALPPAIRATRLKITDALRYN